MSPRGFYSFIQYIDEGSEAKQTTGHLTHVGDLLYHGNPNHAIQHSVAMHRRLQNRDTPNHSASLKVDGGMSFLMGRHHDGKHFVAYKSGREHFTTPEQIKQTGKEHYEKLLIPALHHAKKLNIQPGHAFQADLLWHGHDKESHAQPNTIPYKKSGKHTFGMAVHSHYTVRPDKSLAKHSNVPDHKQLTSHTGEVFSPDLSLHNKKFNAPTSHHKEIGDHIAAARTILKNPHVAKFARSIPQDRGFHELIQAYSNHSARTSGNRTAHGLKIFAKNYISKQKVSDQTKSKKLSALHGKIDTHQVHLDNLFQAHHHINQAKHGMLDILKQHHHHFDIHPHDSHEHEGLVGSLGVAGKGESMAKFTREGPTGFSAKNHANSELRFGKTAANPTKKSISNVLNRAKTLNKLYRKSP